MNNANFVRVLGVVGVLLTGCGSESDESPRRPPPARGIEGTGVRSQGIQGTGFRTQGIQGSGRQTVNHQLDAQQQAVGEAGAGGE